MKHKIINGSIYMWTNRINGKQYVGQTTNPVEWRRKAHIRESLCEVPKSAIAGAIKKHRLENFDFCVIRPGITDWQELNELEIELIAEYDSYHNGYNRHRGGHNEYRKGEVWDSAQTN